MDSSSRSRHDERPRASDYSKPSRPRSRSRSPPPHGTTSPSRGDRRASPVYESYDRVQTQREDDRRREEDARRRDRDEQRREREARDQERERRGIDRERRATPEAELGNGRRGGGGYGYQGGQGQGGQRPQGGGDDWFQQRRKERDSSHINIWPPSPKAPARDLSPEPGKKSSSRKHKSSKSRRHRHSSVSSDSETDSEEDRRRSKKHRSSKHSSSKHRSSKSKSKSSSRRHEDDEDREDEGGRRERSLSATVALRKPEGDEEEDEDMWVEKETAVVADDDAEEVGPLPLGYHAGSKGGRNQYGGALLKGEGSAMAAFVENGERIPRRGEIGMESEQIEKFETMGYVMSGSRHRRMNAVRVRKENQVISAEEKRGILKMQAEEKAKRENQIVSSFKELVDQKLSGSGR
ncbi:NF-kappa-B-activating protein, partial [Phenoliferia sp. Uapishka_3]